MSRITNSIGLLIGIIGIVIGAYFHYSSKENKKISYNISSESFKIYNNDLLKQSQKISLYRNDSVKINQNVYLITFSIWNSGNVPIDPKDVRKDLIIKFKGINDVLDFSVIKEVDPEVSRFTLSQISPSSFNLKWMYFDPEDGIKFQLLYTGDPKVKSEIEGKLLKTEFEEIIPLREKGDSIFFLIISPIALVMLAFLSLGIYKKKSFYPFTFIKSRNYLTESQIRTVEQVLKLFIIIMFFAYLIATPFFYYSYFSQSNQLPF